MQRRRLSLSLSPSLPPTLVFPRHVYRGLDVYNDPLGGQIPDMGYHSRETSRVFWVNGKQGRSLRNESCRGARTVHRHRRPPPQPGHNRRVPAWHACSLAFARRKFLERSSRSFVTKRRYTLCARVHAELDTELRDRDARTLATAPSRVLLRRESNIRAMTCRYCIDHYRR